MDGVWVDGRPGSHREIKIKLDGFRMRRALASIILVTAFMVASASAHAFSLLDSNTANTQAFSLLHPDTWSHAFDSFQLMDPNTWPFIPVPEVATDPNGGITYGVLPV